MEVHPPPPPNILEKKILTNIFGKFFFLFDPGNKPRGGGGGGPWAVHLLQSHRRTFLFISMSNTLMCITQVTKVRNIFKLQK